MLKWALGNRNLHKKFIERYEQVSLLFFIFRNSFIQNYRFLYCGYQKISWWRICRWQVVNFEIHHELGLHLAIDQHPVCPNLAPAWTLTLEMVSFEFWVEIHDAEHVDRCSWKYTRVWLYQLTSDLRDVYFLDIPCLHWWCLKAVSVPTFVLGGLWGSTATSALVNDHCSACSSFFFNSLALDHQVWNARTLIITFASRSRLLRRPHHNDKCIHRKHFTLWIWSCSFFKENFNGGWRKCFVCSFSHCPFQWHCRAEIHLFAGRAVKRERRKGSSRRQQTAYGAAVNEVARELLHSTRCRREKMAVEGTSSTTGRSLLQSVLVSAVDSCHCPHPSHPSTALLPIAFSLSLSLSPTRFDVFKDGIVHNMLPLLGEQPRHLSYRPVYVGFPYDL